jgi:Xaa-Pro aminopeptidase
MSELAENETIEIESPSIEATDVAPTDTADADTPPVDDEEVIVSIGEPPPQEIDEPQASAPEWVRELRKNYRELQREKRELEQRLQSQVAPPQRLQLGPKPTLEGCDYDADKFERDLETWYEQKRKSDSEVAQLQAAQQAEAQAWQNKLQGYAKARTDLKVRDYEEAEHVVLESLDQAQQGIILAGCKNPALVVYAIGKNPAKAKELAAIKDPVQYAFAVAKLEEQLKVTSRKAPPPERTIKGSGPISGSVDSTLERLRSEAEKTGDYSKVMRYRAELKKRK